MSNHREYLTVPFLFSSPPGLRAPLPHLPPPPDVRGERRGGRGEQRGRLHQLGPAALRAGRGRPAAAQEGT